MRSMLFAGATRPDLVAKLDRSGPDAVVIDLEDAVPADAKAEARKALRELVGTVNGPKLFVRVNAPETSWFANDVVAVSSLPITGAVVPKVEAVDDLVLARSALGERAELCAGIESARGVANVESILGEVEPAAAYFGAEDYIADLGGR